MDEQASVDLITALAGIWTEIRRLHTDVPGAVILPAPAPKGRSNVLGHFAALRWQPRDQEGVLIHEVVVVAEHLNRSPEDVLETLLHEAAHAMNFARSIKDCSASQYHNRKFKDAAEALGLVVSQLAHYGFAHTKLGEGTAQRYKAPTERLTEVLVHRRAFWRRVPPPPKGPPGVSTPTGPDGPTKGPARTTRNRKATCKCGYIIRASRKVLSSTTIRCESCGEAFIEEG